MGRLAVLLLLTSGCSSVFGLDKPVRLDAAGDGPGDDAPTVDGASCYGHLHICPTSMPPDRSIATKTINTNSDCDVVVDQPSLPQLGLCVLLGRGILVTGTVKAVGARPLVIVATETLSITMSGAIDVASRNNQTPAAAASFSACTGSDGTNTSGNDAGGGAGGSFQGNGGDGGDGDVPGGAAAAGLAMPPTFVRGGCKGYKGGIASGAIAYDGGDSGGAVYLVAGTRIDVSGEINASGGGGRGGAIGGNGNSGGSGGGSGGLIWLDAPIVSASGKVFANGGGGGGSSSSVIPGNTGGTSTDPTMGGMAGSGAGAGGTGAAGSNLSGSNGATTASGGGGGGGGAGYIQVFATQSNLTGSISPPAIMM